MSENDPKNMNNNNFDKEFSLNREKKAARNGKFPSWIMILAGVAVIAGVVAAKQPVIRPGTGTRASVNIPAVSTVSTDSYNGMSDEKVGTSELEARFASHTDTASSSKNARLVMTSDEQVLSIELDPLETDENGDVIPGEENGDSPVYWVDEKPYALTLKTPEESDDEENTDTVSSVYSIEDRDYEVSLKAVSEDEISALPEAEKTKVVRVGKNAYRVDMVPADEAGKKASAAEPTEEPEEETPAAEKTAAPVDADSGVEKQPETEKSVSVKDTPAETVKEAASAEKTEKTETKEDPAAVAWLDGKPYSVTVKPVREKSEPAADNADHVSAVPADPAIDRTAENVKDSGKQESSTSENVPAVKPAVTVTETVPAGKADADQTDAAEDQTADAEAADETQESELTDKAAGDETDALDAETMAAIMAGAGRFDVSEDQTEQAVPAGQEQEKGLTDKSAVNIPVTVLAEDEDFVKPGQKVQTAVFETEGKQYEIRIAEMDPAEAPQKDSAQPVIWVDTVPLAVTLQSAAAAEDSDTGESSADAAFDIVLSPVPEEEVPALYEEHFGVPYVSEKEEDGKEETVTLPQEEETAGSDEVVETEAPKEDNWFVNVFHDIFGSGPTSTPTPQVTVIAMTPTQAPVKPTATPIVVRFELTATPQSPVRLDENGQKVGTMKDAGSEDYSDWDDPALWEDEKDTLTVENKRATVTAIAQGTVTSPTATPRPATATPEGPSQAARIPIIVVDPDDQNWPTLQPTPEELPQTGMAESWNIPSMLAMLAGLLLIIIGVRRLRRSSR